MAETALVLSTVGGESWAPPFLCHGQLHGNADCLFEAAEVGIPLLPPGRPSDELRPLFDLSNNRRERWQAISIDGIDHSSACLWSVDFINCCLKSSSEQGVTGRRGVASTVRIREQCVHVHGSDFNLRPRGCQVACKQTD
jgi:hypothetical protein